MYNLLMVSASGYWQDDQSDNFDISRFLEYTREQIRAKYLPINSSNLAKLSSSPALFAYEFPADISNDDDDYPGVARVGHISEVRQRNNKIEYNYKFDSEIKPIPMRKLASLAWELDINTKQFENYRTHWAIKDIDLFEILRKNGFLTESNPVAPDIIKQLNEIKIELPSVLSGKQKVFIVHGRDDGIKNEVALWISLIGFEHVILHEQANKGRTLITKFREITVDAAFAIVIMTPDDVGGLAGGQQSNRARQNVIFELGYLLGQMDPSRVAALVVGSDLEKPSDYEGVVYISYDKRGAWKLDLAREFHALGIPFDITKTY